MSKKLGVRSAVMAAFLAVSGANNIAFAIYEVEPNEPITAAQGLIVGDGGSVEVNGAIGTTDPSVSPTNDLDFFSFQGTAGDVVTVDIDGGMKPAGSTTRSVNTILALFKPDLTVLLQNDDAMPLDPGTIDFRDARIDAVRLPVDGTYYVGVSSFPRFFLNGGSVMNPGVVLSNGSYTLIISGVTPPPSLQYISIEVKPGSEELVAINPKSKGRIPVALLSSATFKPLEDIDHQSPITFGASGDESSLLRCGKEGEYVNDDDILDLVCHFDTQKAGFGPGDLAGVVKGKTRQGRKFEGRGDLKVVPGAK